MLETALGYMMQVRNLASCVKVAVDFVLPESLDQAFKFAEEFCVMGKEEAWEETAEGEHVYVQPSDRQHTDKLQAELSMCLAAKHAVEFLSGATSGVHSIVSYVTVAALLEWCYSCALR